MGMSIDEAIRRIDEHNYIHQRKEPRAVYITEAFNTAIETMRKYHKIEQIVNEYNLQLCDNTSDGAYNFQRIKEVIEGE